MSLVCSISKIFNNERLMNRLVSSLWRHSERSQSSLWSPDYLDEAKSKFPELPATNVQIRGYDFVILEEFQRKIKSLAETMNLSVSKMWPQECKVMRTVRYKPNSDKIMAEYKMKLYERNVQVEWVYSYQLPMFIDLVTTMCPPGVKLSVHAHETAHEEDRFVPEFKLLELRDRLDEMTRKK